MRKSNLTRIITNKRIDIVFVAVLLLGSLLRFIRIGELTEFLGDQGRAMLVLFDWAHRGIVPLTGPTVLTGQPLGPAFYYLMFPGFVLFGGDPVGQAIWMAFFGIGALLLLYLVTKDLFGILAARSVTFLWAVAPAIVTSDRVVWEPNLVPFFALLYLYSLVKAHRSGSRTFMVIHGVALGILVQLHYPNIFFVGLTALYAVGLLVCRKKTLREVMTMLPWITAGFVVVLLPFIIHEASIGFTDVREIGTIFFTSGTSGQIRRLTYLVLALRFATIVMSKALPFTQWPAVLVLGIAWLVYFYKNRSLRNVFITVWFAVGIGAMTLYSGVVENHYLNFLTPAPFLMIASGLNELRKAKFMKFFPILLVLLGIIQLAKGDIFLPGSRDVQRTQLTAEAMVQEAGTSNFSFTILYGRSFSDLHYRYFFRRLGREPVAIVSSDFSRLFLVCDQAVCPTEEDLAEVRVVDVLCYNPHCSGQYPRIPLADHWELVSKKEVVDNGGPLGSFFVFDR